MPWRHFWPVTKSKMAAGRHFEKKENVHNSAAIWDIFTKFGTLMAMGIPQRPRMSFLGYNKIQDGGRPPFWKTENRNNSAAVWAIVIKFGKMVDMDSPQRAVTSFLTCIKSKMAAGRHFEKKRKIAIIQPLFEISSRNLICWWPWASRNVPGCHFWATTKSKMARGRHFEKRKIAITQPPFELLSSNSAWR